MGASGQKDSRRNPRRICNFLYSGTSLSSRQVMPGAKSLEDSMKRLIGKLMMLCLLALSVNGFAQSAPDSNQDSMKHDDMKQDTMKPDTMKHDDMAKDDMAKDKKAKKLKKNKMKKDEMKHDDMKKDDMSKDEMKKN
jgi:pentapeptide MXKDX repeat protein